MTYYIIVIVASILIYIIYNSQDHKSKTEIDNRENKYELPPSIKDKSIIDQKALTAETSQYRQEQFNKSFLSFKKKNIEKIKELEQHKILAQEQQQEISYRKEEALNIISTTQSKVKKLSSALSKLKNTDNNE